MLAAAGLLALAGCSSGKVAQTADQQSAIDGVNVNVGQIAIRDAAIVFPMSGDATTYQAAGAAPLAAVLVNSSGTDDTLVSASSPYAKKVTLAPAEDGATPPATGCVASASVLPSASATPSENGHATPKPTGSPKRPAGTPGAHPSGSAAASSSAAPSGSAAPSDSASPSEPTGPSAIGLAVPSSSTVQLVSGCQQLVLSDLSQPVTPAMLVPVTLTFQNAGVVTLQLPFASPATALPRTPVSGFAPDNG
ncbi:hypothetical protein GCM10009765_62220 [Fodinicola feengrottensis]|uniref:Copper chaperone PCu(A)C n=1 Tax=Fodinicola feengrottensis TaxID=435914 RepID=A0ABN2IGH8_9ACTN